MTKMSEIKLKDSGYIQKTDLKHYGTQKNWYEMSKKKENQNITFKILWLEI